MTIVIFLSCFVLEYTYFFHCTFVCFTAQEKVIRVISNSHLNMLQELSSNSDHWKKMGFLISLWLTSPIFTKKQIPFFFPLSRWIHVCDFHLMVDHDTFLKAWFFSHGPQNHMRHLKKCRFGGSIQDWWNLNFRDGVGWGPGMCSFFQVHQVNG